VVDTYPLYSKSDQALLGIGDAYAGQAHNIQIAPNLPGAIKERLRAVYQDRAAEAYAKVITRYPMAPHVEDARDRLVAMNRPVPEPTQAAVAESDAEERSRQPCALPTRPSESSSMGPRWSRPCMWASPAWTIPSALSRRISPSRTSRCSTTPSTPASLPRPAGAVTPTGVNEPPRSDQPSQAPLAA
jgi:outer membrane protein assembly factor BamD